MLSFCAEQMMDSFQIHWEHLWGISDRTNLEYIQLVLGEFTENFCKIYIQYISIMYSAFMGQCPQCKLVFRPQVCEPEMTPL